ncbi:aldehyde dehydrogenase family protein [Myxococcota bacterium]|nr:aldehyde dehydrogenase family protein [Myxococcota bacterium]
MAETFLNLIGGEWKPAASGRTFERRNPADESDLTGVYADSGAEDVAAAVAAAREARHAWAATPAPVRGSILERALELLKQRKERIARIATREMGKTLSETRGDVQEGIDTAFYMAGEGRRWFGATAPSELRDKFAMTVRRPVGVAGLICPWNFPLAIPSWKALPALICGNAVVLKPSAQAPGTAVEFARLLADAGVPPGVFNLVLGGDEPGKALVEAEGIDLVSFTGSSEVGARIASRCGALHKRVSLEMGGKNAQIVMEDADLDLAVEGALWGAFGTTGQRCTATSRLIVHRDVVEEFTARLAEGARRLRLGPGLEEGSQVGPLVDGEALAKVERYVRIGMEEDRARLVTGGRRATGLGLERGWFFEPTLFADGRADMRIAQEEIFGPVAVVIPVSSFDEAIDVQNGTRYGLSSSIYTRDVNRAFRAIERIEAGITYVNGPTIGAECHLPFGGVKETGNGHREAGLWVLETYSEWKSVYVDYSGRLQKAQMDTEGLQ